MRSAFRVTAVVGLLCGLVSAVAHAQRPVEEQGRALAEEHCSRCHAIGLEDQSQLPSAPPLRELPKRYPVENLAEAFAEGIVTAHPAMPQFTFEPPQIAALLSYIDSLEKK
ncbi:MAG: hypothetical protein DIU63_13530 [Proteobacteria bacterium]|jgi:Cytochrome c, mono- and diheme variants|nr:MAG: hypothetical protein DIU63_13530 [Pseudomonadota bacterium]